MSASVARPSRPGRAFTLVEVLVALSAGLAIAAAALLLSRGVSRLLREDARMASTRVAATLGLARLVADVQRAGFLSSAHAAADPSVCGARALWPQGLQRLSAVTAWNEGSVMAHPEDLEQSTANGLRPDALIVGGNSGNGDVFPIRAIAPGSAGGQDVYLQIEGSGAVQRALARGGAGGADIEASFQVGRLLRIALPGQSRVSYGVIAGVQVVGVPPAQVVVHLASTPALPRREHDGCGLGRGAHVGGLANAVSRVRYDLRRLAGHAVYGDLVAPISPAITGDLGRTELVRVELDADDREIPGSLELVAEYAVDLQIGITAVLASGDIRRFPIGSSNEAEGLAIAGDPATPGAAPERVRAVQLRLSTRARAPDREAGIDMQTGGPRSRFFIPGLVPGVDTAWDPLPPGAPPVHARTCTLQTEVALRNLAGGAL
ncbi:hypothetical protein [Chondromyces crocatus]|uniref:Prepilin-type N-terminal cleavage/methylation domain-containing protein n=1 Tax=Chondromyces crocatus TaxID=52 RepID=A0A0K1E8G4_CHOCO|nr:hypothetical protein [Chondromyces crocatus]AKT37145.1 uncharacterized protein CMC5_012750 [Chondromyces crocatus]